MAVILFAGDPRNQFHMSEHDLDFNSRNYQFSEVAHTEAETQFAFTNSIGVTHTVVVSNYSEGLATIRHNQRLLTTDPLS